MVFSSLFFIYVYLAVVLAVFYVAPRRFRYPWLLLANVVFYGWGEPVFLVVLVFSTLSNYVYGRLIDKYRQNRALAKLMVCLSAVTSLGFLAFFKYAGFAAELLRHIPGLGGPPVPKIPLPIGISFYTFQCMSYTIDVYRDDAPCQRSAVNFSMYITLFPQLIAGPIVRYKDFAGQMDGRRARPRQFARGVTLFMIGMAKKVLLANRMGEMWSQLSGSPGEIGVLGAWLGIAAYTLQIYFDFSGYSDMACGLGNMLGFEFMVNFNYPYISRSITEFWRRWHISLSTWFRDYVYIPLGGNRCGAARRFFNLFAVWFLTGLWHGASMNFIAWGLYYFVILVIEKQFLLNALKRAPGIVGHVYSMALVMIGWTIFYFDGGMSGVLGYLGAMFGATRGILSADAAAVAMRYLPTMLLAAAASTPLGAYVWKKIPDCGLRRTMQLVLCIGGLILCTAALASQSYNPFLYFQF